MTFTVGAGNGTPLGVSARGCVRPVATTVTSLCRTGTALVSTVARGRDLPRNVRYLPSRAGEPGTTSYRRVPKGAGRRVLLGLPAPLSNGKGRTGTSVTPGTGQVRKRQVEVPSSTAVASVACGATVTICEVARRSGVRGDAALVKAGPVAVCREAVRTRTVRTWVEPT